MTDWKSKLYESYVSTKQSAALIKAESGLRLSHYPQLTQLIQRHVPAEKSIRIADLGCGHGPLVFCLKELGYKNVEGIDVSSEQVELAHRLGISEIQQGDIFEFMRTGESQFDVIFLMDVLEHLTKQQVVDLLGYVHKALSSSGRAIIHVPNAEGLFGMRVRYGDFTHELCFTQQSIGQVLRACGFDDIAVYEDKPVVKGVRGFVRRMLWQVLTARERLLCLAETGATGHVLSQNMLVVSKK